MQKDTIVKISSVLQSQKIPDGICIRLENHFFPNWRQQNLSKKLKVEGTFFWTFLKTFSNDVSGNLHSAENPQESSMLAKLDVSLLVKIGRGVSIERSLKKSLMEKTPEKKTKFGYSVLKKKQFQNKIIF